MNKRVEPFVGEVLFNDGTCEKLVLAPSVFRFAEMYLSQMPGVLERTGLNQIVSKAPNIVSISRSDHESLHLIDAHMNRNASAQQQAIFRLGQMDMRSSVCDMLRNEAKNSFQESRLIYELIDKVKALEVLNENT